MTRLFPFVLLAIVTTLGCAGAPADDAAPAVDEAPVTVESSTSLPVDSPAALDALNASPRHGEWVDIERPDGQVPLRTWVVYPERADKAPTVVLVAGIYGLNDWTRSTADRRAADGFIALAPDMLSGRGPEGGGFASLETRDDVVALMGELTPDEDDGMVDSVRAYGLGLPAASGRDAIIGFCWGGGVSFRYATIEPELDAAIVYYGTSPETESLASISAPVLGLYGGDDERVNATIESADVEMQRLGKTYEYEIHDGAGHAFLSRQAEQDGANLRATEGAWPRMLEFLRAHTESERP